MSERELSTPRDAFDEILRLNGIDINTDDRTKQLALRGLIAELDDKISVEAERLQVRRGAPRKAVTKSMQRAMRLLGLAEMLHEKGCGPLPLMELVRFAGAADAILVKEGCLTRALFPDNPCRTEEQSARLGLKELSIDMELYRKNPDEFFVQCRLMFG